MKTLELDTKVWYVNSAGYRQIEDFKKITPEDWVCVGRIIRIEKASADSNEDVYYTVSNTKASLGQEGVRESMIFETRQGALKCARELLEAETISELQVTGEAIVNDLEWHRERLVDSMKKCDEKVKGFQAIFKSIERMRRLR